MEQFITGDVWQVANKHISKRQRKTACIAYVTSTKLKLGKNDVLICDASKYRILTAATSAKALNYYFKKGVKIYSNPLLHSKILLTDELLVIGSSNLSVSSAESLIESSIVTNSTRLISQAKSFCHKLIEESDLLDDKDIASLLKIIVKRQPFKAGSKSKLRKTKFGNNVWFLPVSSLSDNTYDKIKDTVEKTTEEIAQAENIEEDDIGFIRWDLKSEFGRKVKEGDQVILKWKNKSKTRNVLYPPSAILKKEVTKDWVYVYHDIKNAERRKTSWTSYQHKSKLLGIEKPLNNRTKILTDLEVDKHKKIWPK